MTALIIIMLFAAFVIARLFHSTKIWWALVIALMAGLLTGVVSKNVVTSNKSETIAQIVKFVDNSVEMSLQSLVDAVTEGTTTCQSGVVSHNNFYSDKLSSGFTDSNANRGRDQPNKPEIQNDS